MAMVRDEQTAHMNWLWHEWDPDAYGLAVELATVLPVLAS
jgi:hypothetical protein